jgi:hypothetical protein
MRPVLRCYLTPVQRTPLPHPCNLAAVQLSSCPCICPFKPTNPGHIAHETWLVPFNRRLGGGMLHPRQSADHPITPMLRHTHSARPRSQYLNVTPTALPLLHASYTLATAHGPRPITFQVSIVTVLMCARSSCCISPLPGSLSPCRSLEHLGADQGATSWLVARGWAHSPPRTMPKRASLIHTTLSPHPCVSTRALAPNAVPHPCMLRASTQPAHPCNAQPRPCPRPFQSIRAHHLDPSAMCRGAGGGGVRGHDQHVHGPHGCAIGAVR